MPDPSDLPLLRLARRTDNDCRLLQAGWPARVRIAAPNVDGDASMLPYLFAPAFAPIADAVLQRFAVGCRLMADKTRLHEASDGMRAHAVQFELHAVLAELLPASTGIWESLRSIESGYAHALAEQEAYSGGRRSVAELTDQDAVTMACAKVPALRLTVMGLGLLAADEPTTDALHEAVDAYAEARDVLRALRAWKSDLDVSRATFATARLARTRPGERDAARLAGVLYGTGIADELLDRAMAACERARAALARVRVPVPWARAPQHLAAVASECRSALGAALAAHCPAEAAS
jgi:hypothetical protein